MSTSETNGGSTQEGKGKRVRSGPLSNRERQVFELLADGLSGAEIAEALVLSPETVRTHIRNAMAKLGASTRSQALVIALRRREISPHDQEPERTIRPAAAQPNAHQDPAEVEASLAELLDGLLTLWDVDAGWIYLAQQDGLGLRRVAERTGEGYQGLPESLALGEGALGRAALERRPQIVQSSSGGDTGAMVVAPLLDDGRLVGALALATRASRPTGRQELLLLQALSGRVAELVVAGGPGVGTAMERALAGFRASWASASRPL